MGNVQLKKILFASTTLVATAGMAAAEVKFSGYGRFGVGYHEDREQNVTDAAAGVSDTILVSRFRLNIDGITETDGGVRFEGRVRLQADENNKNGEANAAGLNGARFSVLYGGLRVDAGNVSGAFDNLANYYGNEPGLENFIGQYSGVNYSFVGYSSGGAGANAAFFQYAIENFKFGASFDPDVENGDRWDASATYTMGNIIAAIAYGETEGVNDSVEKQSLAVLTLGAELGDFSGTLFVADEDVNNSNGVRNETKSGTAYGVSAAYNIGATTLTFAYGDGSGDEDKRQIGVGAIYDLGGGASLRGGIGQSKTGDAEGIMQADFGAQFNF